LALFVPTACASAADQSQSQKRSEAAPAPTGGIVSEAPASSGACANLASRWLGVSLGPISGYPEGLAPGIRREGTARVIEGVGFESLDGTAHGFRFDRIMLFRDRGRFIGFTATLSIDGESDAGYAETLRRLASNAGQPSIASDGTATFSCEPGMELSVQATEWDGPSRRVKVMLMDGPARAQMQQYVTAYCADPARRRPGDACK
jgi:hypothetical protein